MRRAGSRLRRTSRRRSASPRARRRACPTANIASTCCSAPSRRRRRSSRPAAEQPEGRAVPADPGLRRDHPGHRPPRQSPGDGRHRQRPAREEGRQAGGRARPQPRRLALDLRRGPRAQGRASRTRSRIQKGVAVYTEVGKRHVAIPVDEAYKGDARGPGHRPICRDLRRRHRTCSPKPRRCCARRGRAARSQADARRPPLAAQGGDAAGALRRQRRRVGARADAAPPAWTADPDEQFLLDVNIRQLRLGDGVRAYNTPEGTCVVLGDFLTTLDVPMRIDLDREEGERLGVQGKQPDRHRLCARLRPRLRRQERADRARHRSAKRPKAGASRPRRWPAGSGSASSR